MIKDQRGRLLEVIELSAHQASISTIGLSNGVYLIEIDGVVQKLVVLHE